MIEERGWADAISKAKRTREVAEQQKEDEKGCGGPLYAATLVFDMLKADEHAADI